MKVPRPPPHQAFTSLSLSGLWFPPPPQNHYIQSMFGTQSSLPTPTPDSDPNPDQAPRPPPREEFKHRSKRYKSSSKVMNLMDVDSDEYRDLGFSDLSLSESSKSFNGSTDGSTDELGRSGSNDELAHKKAGKKAESEAEAKSEAKSGEFCLLYVIFEVWNNFGCGGGGGEEKGEPPTPPPPPLLAAFRSQLSASLGSIDAASLMATTTHYKLTPLPNPQFPILNSHSYLPPTPPTPLPTGPPRVRQPNHRHVVPQAVRRVRLHDLPPVKPLPNPPDPR